MSRGFRSAIREARSLCHILADKFHVVAVVIDALDEVRKRVQRSKAKGKKKPIYNLRYRLRKGREKLDDEESRKLWSVLVQEPELLVAYLLKEAFRDWYKLGGLSSARRGLRRWCEWAEKSGLEEMVEAAKTLHNWEEEILTTSSGVTPMASPRARATRSNSSSVRDMVMATSTTSGCAS